MTINVGVTIILSISGYTLFVLFQRERKQKYVLEMRDQVHFYYRFFAEDYG